MPNLFTKLNVPFSTPTLKGLLMALTGAGVRFASAIHVSTAAHQELDQVNGTTADGTEQRCLAGLVPDIQQVWALLKDQLRKCVEDELLRERRRPSMLSIEETEIQDRTEVLNLGKSQQARQYIE